MGQSIMNIRIYSNIRIFLNEYIQNQKYSDPTNTSNIFRYSFVGFKLLRIYSDIHSIKKKYSVNEYPMQNIIIT